MFVGPDISRVASLIGDSARSKMMVALLGGKALTATELACEADVTPQTASSHLAKLLAAELISVCKQGRHRYYALHGREVAEVLESLLNLSASNEYSGVRTGPDDPLLRHARVCYDHLAGAQGVGLLRALQAQHFLSEEPLGGISLTPKGRDFFVSIGWDGSAGNRGRRPLCKSCLDWSERRFHIAGRLGKWILDDLFAKGWVRRIPDSRALQFEGAGQALFAKQFGLVNLGADEL